MARSPQTGAASLPRGIALALAAAFWAGLYLIPFKAAAGAADRLVVVLAMLIAAAVLNTAWAAWPRPGRRIDRVALLSALILAVLTVIGNVAVLESLRRVEPAITSVVLQTQVLFVAVLGRLLLAERVTLRLALGAALAVGGFAIMQAPWDTGGDLTGALWATTAALCFALMLVISRRVVEYIEPITVNAIRLWMAVALLAVVPGNAAGLGTLDARAWALVAGAAMCGPIMSRLALMYAVKHISASHTKLITLVSPLFALLLGLLAFGVLPSGSELLGGAVLLCGVALPVLELTASAAPGAHRERPAPEA